MKIGIISDSHDNLVNLSLAIDYFKHHKINHLIHTGDVCYPPTLAHLLKNFSGKVYLVDGNADGEPEDYTNIIKKFSRLKYFSTVGKATIGNKKIAFVHRPEAANKLVNEAKHDLVIHGHTHKPWEAHYLSSNNKKIHLLNPGTLAGMFAKATFAVYDTKSCQAELIILEQLAKEYALKNKSQKN